jgi:hypothetical protein
MKRKIVLLAAAILISIGSYAQIDPVKTMLLQANDMGQKFLAKDYAAFLEYSHPATLKVMRGIKPATAKVTQEMAELEEDGIRILSINFGVPSKIIQVGDELQSTVPQIMVMHIPGGTMTSTTTMLAISQDKGKKWYFIDMSNYDLRDMKALIPSLSDELYLPGPIDPSFEPDPEDTKE